MATSSMAPNGDSLVNEIHIAASPEQVFQALVDPQQVVKWRGGQGEGQGYRCTNFECDLRPGGKWRSAETDAQDHPFEVVGEYLEVDPPRLLVHTWIASWTAAVATNVRWELEPTILGTLVRHRHYGLAANPELAKSFRGWPRMLGWLQTLIEHGETVGDRKALSST